MKKFTYTTLLFVSLLFTWKPTVAQDYIIDFTYLGSRSKFELLVLFGQPVDYDIDLYKIRYKTSGSDFMPDTASGLLVIPQVPAGTQLPIVVYEHGTTNGRTDVPSQLRGGFEVAMAYAAFGFITVAPDYLGLGDSRGFHPYVHALTEAYASLDMLNGSLEYLDTHEPEWNPNFLFVAGYSQGGHASMAVHREIEDFWSFVYPVTAATHMSGPYSISGVMKDLILSDESYGTPAYIAYTVLGYQTVYTNIFNEITEIFKEPFATSISQFYEGAINLSVLNSQLIAALAVDGDTINKRMLQDSIIDILENRPDHPINIALADNDVYEWAPVAPTRLYYCEGDEQVPFENSLIAAETMNGLGAADLQAISLSPTFTHGQCVFPAVLNSIDFFQSFVNPSSTGDPIAASSTLQIYPNPAGDFISIDPALVDGQVRYEIFNSFGQVMDEGTTYINRIQTTSLAGGLYSILCTSGGKTSVGRFVKQ